MTDDRDTVIDEFHEGVNKTPNELGRWLETDESQSVGQKDGGGESVGHESGRRIVEILRTKRGDLSDDDVDHMRKVNGYIKRHMAQGPEGDAKESKWRYSLMNWGHDPLK